MNLVSKLENWKLNLSCLFFSNDFQTVTNSFVLSKLIDLKIPVATMGPTRTRIRPRFQSDGFDSSNGRSTRDERSPAKHHLRSVDHAAGGRSEKRPRRSSEASRSRSQSRQHQRRWTYSVTSGYKIHSVVPSHAHCRNI